MTEAEEGEVGRTAGSILGWLWNPGSHRQRLHFLGAMGRKTFGSKSSLVPPPYSKDCSHPSSFIILPLEPPPCTPLVTHPQSLHRASLSFPNPSSSPGDPSTHQIQGMLLSPQQELKNSLIGSGRINPSHVSIIIWFCKHTWRRCPFLPA